MEPVRVAVLGASGRMGRSLLTLIAARADLELVGALVSPGSSARGQDAGVAVGLAPVGVVLDADPGRALARAQVAIDFSLPVATQGHIAACVAARVGLVLGTTGLSPAAQAALTAATAQIPVLAAANMSLGIQVLLSLVREAAARLPPDYDIEILETHHRHKRDTPSGTALALGEAAAQGRGIDHETAAIYDRAVNGRPREAGSIGYAVLRAGDTIGEHSVWFAGLGERLELAHTATDRATFARGALEAARFLAGRAAGRYQLADVLAG